MNILFLTSAAPLRAGFSTREKLPPLGLGYLMAGLRDEGHRIHFSDEYLQPSGIAGSGFVIRHRIDWVCIYANTICFQSTLKMIQDLDAARRAGDWHGKIVVGGPHTAVGAVTIPDAVDHVVIGEGEIALSKIIRGEVSERIVRGEPVKDLDTLPLPAWEHFVHRPYHWKHPWHDTYPLYNMNTSRGCPFSCRFCSVGSIWGRTYRCMSAERVVADVKHMIRHYGARGIYFREDHFTLSRKRTVAFCELLLKEGIDIEWFCETRVDQLADRSYQKLMHDAGCRLFYIGVESGSQRMLDFYNKGETVEQFVQAFEIAREVGIKTYGSFIVGFPTEREEDIRETERLKAIIRPDFMNDNIYVGIPGSDLYDYIRSENLYEHEDANQILYPVGYRENVKRYYGDNPYYHAFYRKPGLKGVARAIKRRICGRNDG